MPLRLEYPTPTHALEALRHAHGRLDGFSSEEMASATVDYDPRAPKSGCIIELKDSRLSEYLDVHRVFCAEATTRAAICERVRLEEWYSRARLSASARAPGMYMVLPVEGCSSNDLLEVQRTLSCFSGYQARYHEFNVGTDGSTGVGFELELKTKGATPLSRTFQGAKVYELRKKDRSGWHCLPLGWTHPFVDKYSFLLPVGEHANSVTVWNRDGSSFQMGREATVPEERDGGFLADQVKWIPGALGVGEAQVMNNPAPEVKMELELRPRPRDIPPVGSAAPVEVIVEYETSVGGLTRDLLGRLDDADARTLHDAIYYGVPGDGPFGHARHYIRYGVQEGWETEHRLGARYYVQSRIFKDLGLPLFIEEGYAFSPDLRTVLDGLPPEHQLIQELRSDFGHTGEGENKAYLLRWNENARPSRDQLSGGQPLVDMIEKIVFQNGFQFIADQLERMEEEIKDYKRSAEASLEKAAGEETATIRGEFDRVINDLGKSLKEADAKLLAASKRIQSIQDATSEIDPVARDAEKRWNELVDRVQALLRSLVQPRHEWITNVDRRMEDARDLAGKKKGLLVDLASSVKARLTEIGATIDQCESLVETLEKSVSKAGSRETKSKNLVERSTAALRTVEGELVIRLDQIKVAEAKWIEESDALKERQRVQAERRRQLDERRDKLTADQNELRAEKRRLDGVENQINSDRAQADTDKRNLEKQREALPGLRKRRDDTRAEVSRLRDTGVEQDHRDLLEELDKEKKKLEGLEVIAAALAKDQGTLNTILGEAKAKEAELKQAQANIKQTQANIKTIETKIHRIEKQLRTGSKDVFIKKDNLKKRVEKLGQEVEELKMPSESRAIQGNQKGKEKPKKSWFKRIWEGSRDD